jgi:hypothetical protein
MNQGGGGTSAVGNTTAVFRDVSAWYHFVFYADYANTTFKLYVNNVEQTLSYSSSVINADGQINAAIAHQIGSIGGSSAYFDGYLTEIHFIDGQALTPSSFGETDLITGVWKPKKYAGTYGTNGFYLKFADNSGTTSTTLGKDSSGNGNNWTPNNFSVTAGAGNDSLIDTPTPYADGGNGRGNYATWNPLDRTAATYSNGNLDVTSTSAASPYNMASTMRFPATGKWYAEVTLTGLGAGSPSIGIGKNNSDAFAVYRITGAYITSGMGASTSGTPNTYTTNDVIGIAYDAGAGTLEFYKNGVDQAGNITGITASTEWAIVFRADSASGDAATLNAGQRAFAYTPPSGFKALNTQNLPEPSIKKPNQYFDAVTYSGDNTNNRTIPMPGSFQPDLFWVKSRSGAYSHIIVDAQRGANWLSSNSTGGDSTNSSLGWTNTGFTTNGIIIDKGSNVSLNNSGDTYVAWCWDESATPGFDIVTYTGNGAARTIAHSLGVAPSMMIVKNRTNGSAAYHWFVYHASTGATDRLLLNTTGTTAPDSAAWNNTAPTSSVFSVGTGAQTNENGSAFVAYLWSEVAGFSKFGFYTGNGSTDGPFVFCGFRPRWIMFKNTSATSDWLIFDTARDASNLTQARLFADLSNAETSGDGVDALSNGFKMRNTGGLNNASSNTYIFAAFAEAPFKYSLAR